MSIRLNIKLLIKKKSLKSIIQFVLHNLQLYTNPSSPIPTPTTCRPPYPSSPLLNSAYCLSR